MNELTDRRLEEKERRRAALLDAAEAVAAEVGIEQMTMDEVARRARLSRALLYVYFQDKDDLLLAICERALETLRLRFVDAVAWHSNGLEQVEACGQAYVTFAQEFPVHFEALARFEAHAADISPDAGNEGACVAAGDRVHQIMVQAIEQGIRDGSVRADVGTPMLVAVTLWAFMHGTIQLAATKANVLAHDGVSTQQLVSNGLQLCRRSIAAN